MSMASQSRVSGWLREKVAIDYFFWYPAFLCLAWVNLRFLQLIDFTIFVSGIIHFALFVLSLMLIESVLTKRGSRRLRWVSDAVGTIGLLGFAVDIRIFKVLSIHLLKALRMLMDDGLEQTALVLQSSGLVGRKQMWLVVGAIVLLPMIGAITRWATRLLSHRFPINVRRAHICLSVFVGIVLIVLDQVGWRAFGRTDIWRKRCQVMPLYLPFFSPPIGMVRYNVRLPRIRPNLQRSLSHLAPKVDASPNIFIFVLESFRNDAIDIKATPNLDRFKQDCLSFEKTVASANLTHLSWYSIFFADHALYHHMTHLNKNLWGSVPLYLFQQLGYRTHVISGSRLDYRDRDRMIFGKNLELAATLVDSRSREDLDRPEMDIPATELLIERIINNENKRPLLFVTFFESTHHDYYWPPNFLPLFEPYAAKWDFARWDLTASELVSVKNRYLNAVHFVDSLIVRVFQTLRDRGQYDNSIIVVTGDHGEEFLEFGHMTHGTHLNDAQTA